MQECQANPAFVSVLECVAGQLFTDETVVRPVLIERANDVVTVAPDVRSRIVDCSAPRVGIADQIKPVTSPAFAIPFVTQQPHNTLLVSLL